MLVGAIMKRILMILLCGILVWTPIIAQEEGGGETEADETAEKVETIDSMDVEREIEEDRKKREEELAEYKEKLRLAEDKKAVVEARIAGQEKRIPDARKKVEEEREKKDEAFSRLSKISLWYADEEGKARRTYQDEKIKELHDVRWKIFVNNKNAHEKDMAFVEENRWKTEDFKKVRLRMDRRDRSRQLVFDGRTRTVSGDIFTIEHNEGTKTWYRIPIGSKFLPVVQRANVFVVDVTLRPGRDVFETGATKRELWDIHVYISKHFRHREGQESRFELLGVGWYLDTGRPRCWMAKEAPVFEPHPMPTFEAPNKDTPEIVELMKEWRFRDEGAIQQLADAKENVEVCKKNLQRAERDVDRTKARVERQLSELNEQLEEASQKITEYDMIIKEYGDAILAEEEGDDEEDDFGEEEGADELDDDLEGLDEDIEDI